MNPSARLLLAGLLLWTGGPSTAAASNGWLPVDQAFHLQRQVHGDGQVTLRRDIAPGDDLHRHRHRIHAPSPAGQLTAPPPGGTT